MEKAMLEQVSLQVTVAANRSMLQEVYPLKGCGL